MKRTGICLFEDNLNRVKHGEFIYRCPKLKQVILPIKASLNERSSIAGSRIKFLEVRTPKY